MFRVVITTIQEPTVAVIGLAAIVRSLGGELVVIGDQKGPTTFSLNGSQFYSLGDQEELGFHLAGLLPTSHYSRKNLGYLLAMASDANCIYETDDDNAPSPDWKPRSVGVQAASVSVHGWVNAYRYFTNELVWPRGYPLDELGQQDDNLHSTCEEFREFNAPIQQGLANGSPDVDAIWRLVMGHDLTFNRASSLWLAPGSWCPFNSQSTWWWPEAYPLMYLPSYCSFRMTDIWRSFIAQRCLWELGYGVVFHAAEVVQERNEHDLMRDFADEVTGYLRNKELVSILADLKLSPGNAAQGENLMQCYRALVKREFFPEKELQLLQAWLNDLNKMGIG